ncbi:MAG: ABC transporter permease [Gemmataceae bacterium]
MSLPLLWIAGLLLVAAQLLAALPWLAVVLERDKAKARSLTGKQRLRFGGLFLATWAGLGLLLALFLAFVQEPERLRFWGLCYGAVLQAQLTIAGFILLAAALARWWPRGGAVALAAFREGLRQPLFWLLAVAAVVLIAISMFLPYLTLVPGGDFLMMKQLGYDVIMLAASAFAVITACQSISEEIEGRTAITVISKPVSRRQFLLGKFWGIMLSALALAVLIGWFLQWGMYFKPLLDGEPALDPLRDQLHPSVQWFWTVLMPAGEAASFTQGSASWWAPALSTNLGLIMVCGQALILAAIACALATRLPMLVNLTIILVIFFLGHLAPILLQVSQRQQELLLGDQPGAASVTLDLIQFLTRLVDTVLPAMEFFHLGPAIVRDQPLELGPFALYAVSVTLYSLLYAAIALLFGLILFEDRDLA